MADRHTAANKVSLAGLAEGYDETCFALVRQVSYDLIIEIDEIASKPLAEQVAFQRRVISDHFILGKIKVWQADGTQALEDMTAEDAQASVPVMDKVFAEIVGFDLDPKDIESVANSEPTPTDDARNTETPSTTSNTRA